MFRSCVRASAYSQSDTSEIRSPATHDLERLPSPLRALDPTAHYPVVIADALVRLAAKVDARIGSSEGLP